MHKIRFGNVAKVEPLFHWPRRIGAINYFDLKPYRPRVWGKRPSTVARIYHAVNWSVAIESICWILAWCAAGYLAVVVGIPFFEMLMR